MAGYGSSEMKPCPYCQKLFKCVSKHLYRCKLRPDDDKDVECHPNDESDNKEHCPSCAKPFKCVKLHLPHCKMKNVGEHIGKDNGSDCPGKEASDATEQCRHCGKSFKSLNKHLPRCKEKTADDTSDEESDEYSEEETSEESSEEYGEGSDEESGECRLLEESTEEKQSPHITKVLKSLCKANTVDDESDPCRQNKDSDLQTQCPHCQKSFQRLMMHEPKCKLKGVDRNTEEFRRIAIVCELNKRLRKAYVNLRQPDKTVNITIANIKEIMLKKLNQGPCCLYWEAFSSGSYYEILKIDRPDEFDLMFTCKINCEIIYESEPNDATPKPKDYQKQSRMYCALKPRVDGLPEGLVGDDGWLCPKAFRKYFHEKVNEFLREKGRIELESGGKTNVPKHLRVSYSEISPAVTLEYKSAEKIPYTIDLVPAIEFEDFPEVAVDWTCKWIPNKHVRKIRETFHVVAKVHETEHTKPPGQCRLWRLSFSAAEKKLLVSADGKHARGMTTCRKDILRLLKLDLSDFYEAGRKEEPHEFPSYNLKMLVLNVFEQQPDRKDWAKDKALLARYTDALRYWKTSIVERQLPHYFIAGENMLQDDGTRRSQLPALEQWVSKCLDKYVIPEAASAALHTNES